MIFGSIVHGEDNLDAIPDSCLEPDFFRDLNLDRFVREVTAGRTEYALDALYRLSPPNPEVARYRQSVCRDLETGPTLAAISSFSKEMQLIRRDWAQAEKLHYPLQKERIFLETVSHYCRAVSTLSSEIAACDLSSEGLRNFRKYLAKYVTSDEFAFLDRETNEIITALNAIRYTMLLHGDGISVRPYLGEADYGTEVERTFEKFRQGEGSSYHFDFKNSFELNHIEAGVLDLVAQLFPEEFSRLAKFCDQNRSYLDPTIIRFEREVQFYIAYLDYIAAARQAGLPFCYPEMIADKAIAASETFDLVLAHDLVASGASVVTNGFTLTDHERILVVSGANQGGKTTFARTFGQIHHFGRLGLPVPGREARLVFPDAIFTHFERNENVHDLHGKLEDDLLRIHAILEKVTGHSIFVLNEIFSSTTSRDAVFLGRQILQNLIDCDALGVCVTFLDELSRLGPETVSLVATVAEDDPTHRTFRILRRSADGLSHATSLAAKYGLTHDRVKERLAR